MADIDIERNHKLGLQELRRRLGTLEEKLQERYGAKVQWRGDEADIKGPGFTGTLHLAEERVAVALKLNFVMRPLAGKIREAMEKQVDKALA
jgi:putative polyhydroxyalkanoate system protein